MDNTQDKPTLPHLPDPEELARELAKATSMDDLVGKNGVFARMFGKTLSAMLEGELSAHWATRSTRRRVATPATTATASAPSR